MLAIARQRLTVSSQLLLALYAVVPLSLLAVFVDIVFLNGSLRAWLPENPGQLIWWAIIFNFPHIVSSLITLADDEYIPYYRARFQKALIIIIAAVLMVNIVLPLVLPNMAAFLLYGLFFIFFAGYTMYHVLSQQFGIGMMLMKVRPDKFYEIWRYCGAIAATAMYMLVFAKPNFQSVQFDGFTLYNAAQVLAAVFVGLACVAGLYLASKSQRKLGTFYVLSNLFMLIATLLCSLLEYSFFVILIPRLIHDVTAFIIYSTHDHNRNLDTAHNYVYRFLSFIPLPIVLLCPLLAVLAANSIECGAYLLDFGLGFNPVEGSNECALKHFYAPSVLEPLPASMQVGLQILFITGFFHYYIEGFVWKREAIHRHSVSFS